MNDINDNSSPKADWFRHAEIDFNFRRTSFNISYRNLNTMIQLDSDGMVNEWELYTELSKKLHKKYPTGEEVAKSEEYTKARELIKGFKNSWDVKKIDILKLVHNILIAEAHKYKEEYIQLHDNIKNIITGEDVE